jgi:hypothetical protein
MNDTTLLDATEPEELADELDAFSGKYAKRTGDYVMAGTFMAAAEWLRYLREQPNDQ